ncbi:MAG: GTP cyclohydrolase II [Proteobacteria bacterium]|nr:GTP cyclohydrolase II [Pseudomonadota bacterium]
MFSYVDQKIKEKLLKSGRLVALNLRGEVLDSDVSNGDVISLLGPIPLPVLVNGEERQLHWYAFVRRVELRQVQHSAANVPDGASEAFRTLLQQHMSVNSILMSPGFANSSTPPPLVRVHSCCMTGDVFGSMRCECGPQLEAAFAAIAAQGGAVVYMSSHEGRGIGLWAKAVTYLLQDEGQDTYQANVSLGLPEDSRDFSDAAAVLRYFLKGAPVRLMSNNPLKKRQLEDNGQPVAEVVSHVTGVGQHNLRYLRAKKQKGHALPEL